MNTYVFYIPDFSGGGAEKVFVNIANELSGRGHEVFFIVNIAQGVLHGNLSPSVKHRF